LTRLSARAIPCPLLGSHVDDKDYQSTAPICTQFSALLGSEIGLPGGVGCCHGQARDSMNWRRLRGSLAIIAVTVEVAAFVVWRLWLCRRGR
jgi:hypothetical protein